MATRSSAKDSLARHRSKRDFSLTAEPRGARKTRKSKALSFVIQKHAAKRAVGGFVEIATP